jgi:hypothetical protein
MAKPNKPKPLTVHTEAQFVYDGAGDIYRPLRLLREKYLQRAIRVRVYDHWMALFYDRAAVSVGRFIPPTPLVILPPLPKGDE